MDISRLEAIERDIRDLRTKQHNLASVHVWMVRAMLEELFDENLITQATRAKLFEKMATELAELHAGDLPTLDALDRTIYRASEGILPQANRRLYLESRRPRR